MVHVAIETSTRQGSVAIDCGNGPQGHLIRERAHAVDLLPTLEKLLSAAGSSAAAISAIAVGIGPGSYTGLRVGIATALGLARGSGAKVIGIPSLEALAWEHGEHDVEIDVLFNAYARSVYHARYVPRATGVDVTIEPTVIAPDDAAACLAPHRPILGDATITGVVEFDASQLARLKTECSPTARALLELARPRLERGEHQTLDSLRPLYLKKFEARARRP